MQRGRLFQYIGISIIFILFVFLIQLAIQRHNLSSILYQNSILNIGDKAFVFMLNDINGNRVTIQGDIVLLAFFNTTCNSCLKNIQMLQYFFVKYASMGIKVIGVSSETAERTLHFARKYKISFPIVADPNYNIFWKYHVKIVPLLVLVNKEKKIVFYQQDDQDLNDALLEIEKYILSISDSKENNYSKISKLK